MLGSGESKVQVAGPGELTRRQPDTDLLAQPRPEARALPTVAPVPNPGPAWLPSDPPAPQSMPGLSPVELHAPIPQRLHPGDVHT